MKALHWKRIIAPAPKPQVQETEASTDEVDAPTVEKVDEKVPPVELWQEIDEMKLDNMDEFAELFSAPVVVPKKTKESALIKPLKVKCIKVLDCKRSKNVGIFARSLHVDFGVIEHAIYHWDTSNISLETLQRIMEQRPTSDELDMIKEAMAAQCNTPLDGPEHFLLQLSAISCAEERITCILFQTEFDEACSAIGRKVDVMQQVCKFLIESEHLKRLFSIILTLGNYMNGGNHDRGRADGFQVDILKKLSNYKSNDPKVTLLHFIVKTYIKEFRQKNVALHEIVNPVPDVIIVKQAIDIDFDEVKKQVIQLKTNIAGK